MGKCLTSYQTDGFKRRIKLKKLALMFSSLLAASASVNAFDIDYYCRQVSDAVGGSYQIEKACRQQEYEAQSKINSMSVPSKIKNYCTEVGEVVGGSYQIMEACIQQELQVKSSLY